MDDGKKFIFKYRQPRSKPPSTFGFELTAKHEEEHTLRRMSPITRLCSRNFWNRFVLRRIVNNSGTCLRLTSNDSSIKQPKISYEISVHTTTECSGDNKRATCSIHLLFVWNEWRKTHAIWFFSIFLGTLVTGFKTGCANWWLGYRRCFIKGWNSQQKVCTSQMKSK